MSNPLAVLRYRGYAAYAAARFCATLCWQMLSVAVGWQVYALTRSPMDLGYLGLVQFLPFVLLVLVGGYVADHADRRRVLMASYALAVSCAGVLAWCAVSGSRSVWPIFAVMTAFGAGRAFWMPAAQAITPNLVPVEAFPSAVALNSMLLEAAVIIGPSLGGVLYLVGPALVYGVVAALLLVSVALIFTVKPLRQQDTASVSQTANLLDGLRYVVSHPALLGAISLDLFAVLLGGATALLPAYARDVLHVGPDGLGLLRTATGLGAALTAVAVVISPIERRVGRWMFAGVALFGLSTVVFGLSRNFTVSLIALLLLGMGDMVSVYVRQVLIQLETPDAIRGRVSAVGSMFIGASNELGEFESGLTARWFGLVPAVVAGGVATLVVVAAYLKLFPQLRLMDRFR
ncbi:MAG TPA: MFS transporter, partial [Steroidobacteraceae bacterium]|nr:MFS transporter [Steroidobacteraceae bacterium]